MRMHKLLAAALLVGGALVMMPGVASAQTNSNGTTSSSSESSFANSAAEDCSKLLSEGKTIDDCQKAPSPILPEKNELIWGTISFVVLFLLLWKFAWPGLKRSMDTRTERIRDDLNAADLAKSDAEQALEEYRVQLQDARNESARIIEEARQQSDALRREQEQRLQTELAEMRERAAADVESAKQQAVADLRREVATLAIGAAEVIVQRSLDRPTQEQLVDNYIAQVSSRAN
jgi:F-type H+-transporting ATPase subunit b